MDSKKYPKNPKDIELKKEIEKKSNNRAAGILASLFVKRVKPIIPPSTPPTRESPGKYGKAKKTNGFKNRELGFRATNKTLEPISANNEAAKAILKTFSVEISLRSKTKSSFTKRYKQNKNIKKQISITKIKKCIEILDKSFDSELSTAELPE